jgi:DNA-binding transcriptional regulator LsrR (DeoR family)
MDRWLKREEPVLIAVGTGRTLKAAVELLPRMDCRHHRVVSLTGNIAPDGSAAYYNVVFTMSDSVNVRSFPMPLPVIATSRGEREMLHAQAMIKPTLALAARADVTFVGIGDFSEDAPLYVDGFITAAELAALRTAGAAGEIVGWSFDSEGKLIQGITNERVASAPIPPRENSLVIAAAKGSRKFPGISGALRGNLINGLITDEETAEHLLKTV